MSFRAYHRSLDPLLSQRKLSSPLSSTARGVLSNFLCRTNTVEAPLRYTIVHSTYSTCTCIFKTAWSRFARRSDCRFQTTAPRRDDLFAKSSAKTFASPRTIARGLYAKYIGSRSNIYENQQFRWMSGLTDTINYDHNE